MIARVFAVVYVLDDALSVYNEGAGQHLGISDCFPLHIASRECSYGGSSHRRGDKLTKFPLLQAIDLVR